jgi:hypothetical protein
LGCREEKSVYALTILAEDGQFSSLLKNNRPNQTPQKYRIVIKDKNDNPPYFPQQVSSSWTLTVARRIFIMLDKNISDN